MTKELENLNTLKDMLIGNGVNDTINDYVDKLIEPIKQRLEAIDNAKPSEALKCLESMKDTDIYINRNVEPLFEFYKEELNTIKQALIQAQEQEKVLSIIKEKEVDIHLLKACITCYRDSLNAYNSEIKKLYSNHKDYQNKPLSFYLLTEEEFELLKSEVVE